LVEGRIYAPSTKVVKGLSHVLQRDFSGGRG
jgi:hypothetical protein